MTLYQMIFYFFAAVAVTAVIGIFVTKNIFKAAIFLLICLLSVAAIYVTLAADFVAVTQILIYAAGIVVLLIFGIMLTTKIAGKPLLITNSKMFPGLLIGVVLFALLMNVLSSYQLVPRPPGPVAAKNNIEQIGMNLLTEYALPFEVAGMLLLIALIGAIVTTSFTKSKNT
jgi:NADH:ubiquinone oxidoreductase subunit 6 (subunit J)